MKEERKQKRVGYHIAISEVVISEFGINPAKNTRISKAQNSKLAGHFEHEKRR